MSALWQSGILAAWDADVCLRWTWSLGHALWVGAAGALFVMLADAWFGSRAASWRYRMHLLVLILVGSSLPVAFAVQGDRERGSSSDGAPERLAAVDGGPRIASIDGAVGHLQPAAPESARSADFEEGGDPPEGDGGPIVFDSPAPGTEAIAPPGLPARDRPANARIVTGPGEPESAIGVWLPRSITWGYLAGAFLVLAIRMTGLVTIGRWRRRATDVDDADVLNLLSRQAARLGLRTTPRLAECRQVVTPVVAGVIRPAILLPVSLRTGLTPQQLSSLLLHELAHIRRCDPLLLVIQRMIETVLFFHPGVWLISRRVSLAREQCCDDLVLDVEGDHCRYADALLRVAEWCLAEKGRAVGTFGGTAALGSGPSQLKGRIRRVLGEREPCQTRWSGGLAGLVAVLALVCWIGWPASPNAGNLDAGGGAVRASEPPPPALPEAPPVEASLPSDQETNPAGYPVVRGNIRTGDGTPLPDDLKLEKRISGRGFAEWPKPVDVGADGTFAFTVTRDEAFVRLFAVSSQFAPLEVPLFEVTRGEQPEPLALVLDRGFTARIALENDGGPETTGSATVRVMHRMFTPAAREIPVRAGGVLELPHCGTMPMEIDILLPGYEEQRVHQTLPHEETVNVTLAPARPSTFRLVREEDGEPLDGAVVRLFALARKDGFRKPFWYGEQGPVRAVSDSGGRVVLESLAWQDPVPSNDPGRAVYAFRVEAPGREPAIVGGVLAGENLGDIAVGPSLTLRGHIELAEGDESVRLQWRQPTGLQHQGVITEGDWELRELEGSGRVPIELTGLRKGPIELYMVFSGSGIRQVPFQGYLRDSVGNVVFSRQGLQSEHDGLSDAWKSENGDHVIELTATPELVTNAHRNWVLAHRSNVPPEILSQLLDRAVLMWMNRAPGRRSASYETWRLFVLDDGTVFVPGDVNSIGVRYKLSREELDALLAFVQQQQFSDIARSSVARYNGWDFGARTLLVETPEAGRLVAVNPFDPDATLTQYQRQWESIESHLNQLVQMAAAGGELRVAACRDTARKVLAATLPDVAALGNIPPYAWIDRQGNRHVGFRMESDNVTVRLLDPIGGPPYVQVIERNNVPVPVRTAEDPPSEAEAARRLRDSRRPPDDGPVTEPPSRRPDEEDLPAAIADIEPLWHDDTAEGAVFLDNQRLLTGPPRDEAFPLRAAGTGAVQGTFPATEFDGSSFELSGDRRTLLTGASVPFDLAITGFPAPPFYNIWDVDAAEMRGSYHPEARLGFSKIAIDREGKWLVVGNRESVQVIDLQQKTTVRTMELDPVRVDAVAISPDGRWIVVSDRNDLYYWEWQTGRAPRELHVGRTILSLAFSPDSRFLAEGPDSRSTIQVRELTSLDVIAELATESRVPLTVQALAFRDGGRQLVAANAVQVDETRLTIPHRIHVWDVAGGQAVYQVAVPRFQVNLVDLSPDGRYAAFRLLNLRESRLAVWELPAAR